VGNHGRQGQAAQVDWRRGAAMEEHGVRLGLTLTAPPFWPPFIPHRNRPLPPAGPSRPLGPPAGPRAHAGWTRMR
jgi:hypothetical protein